MHLSPELREELLALTASVRGHLEAEQELGAPGLALTQPASRLIAPRSSELPSASGAILAPGPTRTLGPTLAHPPPPTAQPIAPVAQVATGDKLRKLALLAEQATGCTRCALHEKRNRSVFARGSPDAEVVFVGEGPGRDEDAQGLPFVGAAGQLLDRMIAAMGYARDAVYICNVVKCRPPENRTPRPEEAVACSHFLVPQLELVAPKAIVALGRCAAQALGVAEVSGPWRGRWGTWRGVPILPTYHPAFLLRSPEFKRTVWEDLQQVMVRLGRSPAPRRS
jgi:uracil-DNA glycosylase family 4